MTAIRPRHIVLLCGALAIIPQLAAQSRPADDAEPARFLRRHIGLGAADVELARRGGVVVKLLESADRNEVAVFGIVSVGAPRAFVVERMRDLRSALSAPGRAAFGVFGEPAVASDARSFVADREEIDALRRCRAGECLVKLPATTMESFRRQIDWSARHPEEQANALIRQRMAEYVTAYRQGGSRAMLEYGDTKTPVHAGDVFAALLARSPYVFEYVPEFHQYLASYPHTTLPGVTDALYWSTDKMPSLRPVLSITHLSIYTPPGAPLTLMSAKQLYASHYFEAALDLSTVLDRPDGAGGAGVYVMVLKRMRFDNLPSGGLLNIRGKVLSRMQESMRADLAQRKAGLEREYGAKAAGGR